MSDLGLPIAVVDQIDWQQEPWQGARWVLQHLQDAGFEAHCVGGCVRDILLQQNVSDVISQLMRPLTRSQKFFNL